MDTYEQTFQDRMADGKDAALHRDYSRLRGRVTYQRPKVSRFLTVPEVATLWGVTDTQVKHVLQRGGIPGAFRSRKGRGRGWRIPFVVQDGVRVVAALPGARGKEAAYAKRVPF